MAGERRLTKDQATQGVSIETDQVYRFVIGWRVQFLRPGPDGSLAMAKRCMDNWKKLRG